MYPVRDVRKLAEALERVLTTEGDRLRMASKRIISTWSVGADVEGVIKALEATVGQVNGRVPDADVSLVRGY